MLLVSCQLPIVCALCWATVSAKLVPCCPAVMLYCPDQFT